MKVLLFASCLALVALPMCKPDTAKTTTEAATLNPASPTEVRAQFVVLRDSAESSWQRMMSSDDQKLANVRGLLQDLKKQPRLDAAQVRILSAQANRLQPLRYDRQSMASSALIDRYDAAQDSVLKLYKLVFT